MSFIELKSIESAICLLYNIHRIMIFFWLEKLVSVTLSKRMWISYKKRENDDECKCRIGLKPIESA
jgi:hypothetical protein